MFILAFRFVYVQYPFNDVHIIRRVKNSTGSFDIFFCFEYIYGSLDGGRTWPGCVFSAALQLSCTGISGVFSLLIFFSRMRRHSAILPGLMGELRSMLRIAVPSVLQQSTVSIGMMIATGSCKSIRYTGTHRLFGNDAGRKCFFTDFCIHWKCSLTVCIPESWRKENRTSQKRISRCTGVGSWFAVLAFVVIETLHTQISSLFLGKDGTALAYQVSGDYMRWLGYFFIFMGIKMATDGVLRGLGNHAAFSHCKYGQPGNPSVSCFDLRTSFWYRICLACCTCRLVG